MIAPSTQQSPVHSKQHHKLILTYLNMPSNTIMDGEVVVATLHVLLTAPNSEHGQVSVQQTKGTRTPDRASLWNRFLPNRHGSSIKQTTAATKASKGIKHALWCVKMLDQQATRSIPSTDLPEWWISGSDVLLTSGKTWTKTLASQLKAEEEWFEAKRAEMAGMTTDPEGSAVAEFPYKMQLECLRAPDYRVRTIFYGSKEEALYQEAGDNDFPNASHISPSGDSGSKTANKEENPIRSAEVATENSEL